MSIDRLPPGPITGELTYLIPDWIRVRKEAFGLLFYDTRSTRLTFVRSGESLEPPAFAGGSRLLRVAPGARPPGAALARLLQTLADKGLIVAQAE